MGKGEEGGRWGKGRREEKERNYTSCCHTFFCDFLAMLSHTHSHRILVGVIDENIWSSDDHVLARPHPILFAKEFQVTPPRHRIANATHMTIT